MARSFRSPSRAANSGCRACSCAPSTIFQADALAPRGFPAVFLPYLNSAGCEPDHKKLCFTQRVCVSVVSGEGSARPDYPLADHTRTRRAYMAVRVEHNAEPIPGYRLLERLGGGGFGEV